MMQEMLVRFLLGGAVVSGFAALADVFRPKSFAGLFGAAPSIALATLGLTIAKHGAGYASIEARSMVAAGIGFAVYAALTSRMMMRHKPGALLMTIVLMPVWFLVSFGLYFAMAKLV